MFRRPMAYLECPSVFFLGESKLTCLLILRMGEKDQKFTPSCTYDGIGPPILLEASIPSMLMGIASSRHPNFNSSRPIHDNIPGIQTFYGLWGVLFDW